MHIFKRAGGRYFTSTTRKRVSLDFALPVHRGLTRLRVVLVFPAFGWLQRCAQQWDTGPIGPTWLLSRQSCVAGEFKDEQDRGDCLERTGTRLNKTYGEEVSKIYLPDLSAASASCSTRRMAACLRKSSKL